MIKLQPPLTEIAGVAKAAMEKLAGQDEYIGPPFHFLTITAEGVKKV